MAIFKRQHKKDQGSASNRNEATGAAPASPRNPASLNGSAGRSGIPVPGANHAALQGSTTSSLGNSANGYSGATGGGSGLPPPVLLPPHHNGAAAAAPQYPHAQPPIHTGAPPSKASHTVLYPWSQRNVSLLPSQLLPPSSPLDAPAQPLAPLLGPPSPLPFPRYGHSVNPVATASPSGDLYIFGGLVQNAVKNDLFVVHAAAASAPPAAGIPGGGPTALGAATLSPLPVALVETRGEVPGPRVGHASVGVGNVLIVWGGDTKTRPEERQDDGLYLLNLSTRDWTRVKTVGPAPEGRYGHAAAMVGSRFFVFGGQTDDGGFRNDLCWFDLQKLKLGQPAWSFVEYHPGQVVPPPRTGHTCVTHGDCLHIFGGTDGQYHYNDTWQYDLSSGEWTELACIGYIPVPREGHAATLVDDVMYIFGGRGVDGKDLDDLAAFKISNHRWFMFQNMGPAPSGRSGHAMATYGSKVLVLGGESYTSAKADDPAFIHVLDTTKIKYPPDSARPAPVPTPGTEPAHPSSPQQQPFPRAAPLGPATAQNLSSSAPASSAAAPTGAPVERKSSIPTPGFAAPTRGPADALPAADEQLRVRAASASPTGKSSGPLHSAAAAGGIAAAMLREGSATSSSSPTPGATPSSGPPYPRSDHPAAATTASASNASPPASRFGFTPNGPASPRRDRNGGPQRPARPDDAAAFSAEPAPAAPPSPSKSTRRHPREREISNGSASNSLAHGEGGSSPAPVVAQAQAPADAFYYRTSPSLPNAPASYDGERERAASGDGGEDRSRIPNGVQQHAASSALLAEQGSPSGAQMGTDGEGVAAAANAAAMEERDRRLEQLEAREAWLREALRRAEKQGFNLEGSEPAPVEAKLDRAGGEELRNVRPDGSGGEQVKEVRLREALGEMKQELARAKNAMAEEVTALDERFQGTERARVAALQEAAYYRAKLNALEAGHPEELAKVERERTAALEAQLADALSARQTLESQVATLERDAAHHAQMRSAADERHAEATRRASTAEADHARVLAELTALQNRTVAHERSLGEHVDQLAALQASSSILEGEHARAREQLAEHEASTANWLATLEGASAALTAAQARNDELSASWEQAKDQLATHQTRVAELEQQVEQLRMERDQAMERADEAERMHQSTREAHQTSHALVTGGLAQLLAAHRPNGRRAGGARGLRNLGTSASTSTSADRDVDGYDTVEDENEDEDREDLAPEHAARVRAADEQVATLRQYHAEVQSRHADLSAELAAAREREAGLLAQLATLRTQLSTVQNAHTQVLDELGTHKSLVATHEATARETARARDAAQVKAGVLRSLLADHGLAAQTPSDDELANRFPSMTGSESPDQLAKRVLELEGELEARMRQKAQLEDRVREHESEQQRLRDELEQVKSGGGEDKARAGKAQEELEALQGRHQQLEATHLKAVQYVKGTEKMLRRMKEELTRYKERCEELESPERKAELDGLRVQVQELRSHSEASSREKSVLHERLASMQNELQTALREHESAQAKVHNFSGELERLAAELKNAKHDLEETHAVNASLNKELQAALEAPASSRGTAGGVNEASHDYSRLKAELEQAENQAEWLKRENVTLEERCRSAESKIAILLDHMEGGVQDDQYSVGGSPPLGGSANLGSSGSATAHSWQQHDLDLGSDGASK